MVSIVSVKNVVIRKRGDDTWKKRKCFIVKNVIEQWMLNSFMDLII